MADRDEESIFQHQYIIGGEQDLEVRGIRRSALGKRGPPGHDLSLEPSSPLNKLLYPLSGAAFTKKYFGKNFFHGVSHDRKRLRLYFNLESLIDLITSNTIPVPYISLIDQNQEYLELSKFLASDSQSKILDPIKIMRHLHYQKGSCLLQNLGNFVPSVSKLATEFRNWTNHEINVNSYYTSSGAQTFKWHWDNHDVFLLQVHGKKEWEIFEPPFSFPLSHQQFWSWPEFTKKQCKPGKKLTLDEGDILYIPAGFPHFGKSTDTSSLHLTIGLESASWLDIISEIYKKRLFEAEHILKYRQRIGHVPPKKLDQEFEKEVESLLRDLAPQYQKSLIEKIYASHRTRNNRLDIRSLRRLWTSWSEMDKLSIQTWVQKTNLEWSIIQAPEENWFEIVLPEQQVITFSTDFLEAVRYVLKSKKFKISNLPGIKTKEKKLKFIKLFLDHGLISTL